MMRRVFSSVGSPVGSPTAVACAVSSANASFVTSCRGKATSAKTSKASSPPRSSSTARSPTAQSQSAGSSKNSSPASASSSQGPSKKLLGKLLGASSPKGNSRVPPCPVQPKNKAQLELVSPKKTAKSPATKMSPATAKHRPEPLNETELILENFYQGFKKAVPSSDKATNIRIARFEEKEFLFVAEPSTTDPNAQISEEGAAEAEEVVTLNSMIAEDLNLRLPPSLLLNGTETAEEAELILEAKEKEINIKQQMVRELKSRGFDQAEIMEALATLDGRMEQIVAEDKATLEKDTAAAAAADSTSAEKPTMEQVASDAVNEFDNTRQAFLEAQAQEKLQAAVGASADPSAASQQQEEGQMDLSQYISAVPEPEVSEADAALQAEVMKMQEDYAKIFAAEQPRLFMSFMQRGSFDLERNNSTRRIVSNNTFLDRLERDEPTNEEIKAQEEQAEAAAQAELEAQEAKSGPGRKRRSLRKAKSNHQQNLVGAVEQEVIQTEVDTDHLGLTEQEMKFFVNTGEKGEKSLKLEKSSGLIPAGVTARKPVLPQVMAGVSLVALGLRMATGKPETHCKPNLHGPLVTSHAYILEGSRMGMMKKRANDLYHPLLLSTCSSPAAAPIDEQAPQESHINTAQSQSAVEDDASVMEL